MSEEARAAQVAEAIAAVQSEAAPPKPAEPAAEAAPAAPPPAPAAPEPDQRVKFSLEQLAKEKATIRQQMDELKPIAEVAKHYDPQTLATIARAKAEGDPLSALAALGFSYKDYASAYLAKTKQEPKEKEAPAPVTESPEVSALKTELEQLKSFQRQLTYERMVNDSSKLLTDTKKFPLINARGAVQTVLNTLADFQARTGALPADNFNDSVVIAAEHVEKQLRDEWKTWRGINLEDEALTPPKEASSVPTKQSDSTAVKYEAARTPGRTLTNAVEAQPRKPSTPDDELTREQRIEQVLRELSR